MRKMNSLVALLLGNAALLVATPAFAQQPEAAAESPEAKIEKLQAQVNALQEAIDGLKAQMVQVTPAWKGAPQLEDKENGFSFKPRGRIQYDAGYVENPGHAVATRNLGFNARARRIRLGVEGTIPGGFGYKAEADFANSSVGFGDVIITYAPKGQPYNFIIGNHETWNGLEQLSSSRFLSFMERAAFDDAFVNTRRLGVSAGLVNSAGDLRFNAGLFAAHSIDSSLDNDGWIAAARGVYSPQMGGNQLHFGANYHHRDFQSNNGTNVASSTGQPSTNQLARYRARPFSQLTDQRFVDTGNFAAKGDDIFGLEFAGIFKSLHVAAEGQYLKARAYDAGDRFDAGDPLDFFPTPSVIVPNGNPSFWGGYAEAGYYLTGETRGYKAGTWDRTKVLKPFSNGGWGALQINGRMDYLDLADARLESAVNNNFSTGAFTSSVNRGRGGRQLGLLASLVWIPEDWMRIYLQYSRAAITGGPQAGTVVAGTDPLDERDYSVDSLMTRMQIDF